MPSKAGPWVDLVHKVYPDDADHIIEWFAQRVQHPEIKINHGLVLGSQEQGIGKDTILEGVKRAVGAWNFKEVAPQEHVRTTSTVSCGRSSCGSARRETWATSAASSCTST